jgi:hypothetical protein
MPVPLPEPERRAALALLERRYDGPIPGAERRLAEFGSAVSLLEAAGNEAFYRALTRRLLATLRQRRAAGTASPALFADFRLYRSRWRYWRRLRATLQASSRAGVSGCASNRGSPHRAAWAP